MDKGDWNAELQSNCSSMPSRGNIVCIHEHAARVVLFVIYSFTVLNVCDNGCLNTTLYLHSPAVVPHQLTVSLCPLGNVFCSSFYRSVNFRLTTCSAFLYVLVVLETRLCIHFCSSFLRGQVNNGAYTWQDDTYGLLSANEHASSGI